MSRNNNNQPIQEDLEEQYLPDFSKISNASLQKYKQPKNENTIQILYQFSTYKKQMFYNIDCPEEELIDKVKKHFKSHLEINTNQLYEKLFKLKREEREELKKQYKYKQELDKVRKTLRTKKDNPKSQF